MSARFTLDDSDSYRTLTSIAASSSSLGLVSGFCPSDQMFAASFLQICSFQSLLSDKPLVRLAADTLAFGCNLPTIRAVWELSPVRVRPCWTNKKSSATRALDKGFQGFSIGQLFLFDAKTVTVAISVNYGRINR